MASVAGIRMAGLAVAAPEQVRTAADEAGFFGAEGALKISQSVGVERRPVVPSGLCTSDLCFSAAERLLDEAGWERDSIDALVFVSQTPDYLLPATSCVLQKRLGLPKRCAAFDVNLGCSGYVYGLWIASGLLSAGLAHRVLLLAGDTISRISSPQDRSVALLFGDAGTATGLERDPTAEPIAFEMGTDGGGHDHLKVPAGMFRSPRSAITALRSEREGGNVRSDEDLYMNGAEIFAFTLREVPGLVRAVMEQAGWSLDTVDAVVMHQANLLMLKQLGKKLGLPPEKMPLALEQFGNTSSASIPVAMAHALRSRLRAENLRLVLAGFGVGFSWGAAAITCGPMVVPEIGYVGGEVAAAAAS